MCIKMTAAAQLPRFFTYFSSFWINRKGPECFSVYNQPRRTNNNIENFHSTLKQTFQVLHPNLWKVLEQLNNIMVKQHIIVDQLAEGLQIIRFIRMKYILNSIRIKNSTALLTIGSINVREFLIQCLHSTDNYLQRELNWRDETLSSEDDFQEIGEIPVIEDAVENQPMGPINNFAEPEFNIVEDENDFIIPEDREMNIWEQFLNDSEDGVDEVPFVRVPHNLVDLYPQQDEESICVVCRMNQRTHALVPCGHRVLCIDCLEQLEALRCPICNEDFTSALRVW
ncbi:unnamed protein product [Macrosiphum euphorbiae]|uniref:RING-type domain-containing protein n=1 Tax=Macrosiphum euphorbiae TaxID=13131 RepID=A0AAV0Y5U0_9HEMI|nr:unnamed protein product [Macrosiphum euphorbiae]